MTDAANEGRERFDAVEDPLADFDERDTSVTPDPQQDPAQREWEGEGGDALDPDVTGAGPGETTGTGADPAEIPDEEDEIPIEDLPFSEQQPDSQGEDPALIDLGPDGQGDIQPEDR